MLLRIDRGLCAPGSPVTSDEAAWVGCRLSELLGWPLPSMLRERIPRATLARLGRA